MADKNGFYQLITCFLIAALLTAADQKINPEYTAWANFKPESKVTLSADVVVDKTKVHIDRTSRLISVNPDSVVVETIITTTLAGQSSVGEPMKQTIKASDPARLFKETAQQDLIAIGRVFHCRQMKMISHAATQPTSASITAYICDDVPGGLVKLETHTAEGESISYVLTDLDSK